MKSHSVETLLLNPLLTYLLTLLTYIPNDSFPDINFDDLEDDECLSEFRFHKRDLPLFAELYNEVNELIISRCLIRLAQQFSACRLIKFLLN